MKSFRYLAIGILMIMAMLASAQQTTTSTEKGHGGGAATDVDQHLQMLTERLNLTADQQNQVRPVLRQFLEGRHKVVENQSLTDEQRREKIRVLHERADKQVRPILNDDQKKKLDQLEQESNH